MSKYTQRLLADEKARKKSDVELSEAHAKASVQTKISEYEARNATLTKAYENALTASNFDVEKVFAIEQEKAENNRKLEFAQSILTNEFGE